MMSEMLTGIKPFLQYCNDPLTIQQYILDGLRPTFDDEIGVSDDLKDLIENMWEGDYKLRPDFESILETFRDKRIAFPDANQDEIDEFYNRKENKFMSKPPSSLKRRLSVFLKGV